jgi:demethoxyubiquinone hydroxylase (CLK1/Coq7/Cat5 family)
VIEAKGPFDWGDFDMAEFETKVVKTGVKPTLLLLEWEPGFVVGGFAGVAGRREHG